MGEGLKKAFAAAKATQKQTYWYFIWYGECPVCGSSKGYRERRYTPKPEEATERYGYLPQNQTYDHCLEGR